MSIPTYMYAGFTEHYDAGYGVNRHRLVRRYLETGEPFVEEETGENVFPMHLPEDALEDICTQNAIRLTAPEPKPVDRAKAYALCREVEKVYWNQLADVDKQNLKTMITFWERLGLSDSVGFPIF